MNLVIWLVVGALMGGAACFLRREEDATPPIVMNVVLGVAGALAGGWFFSPLFGGSTSDQVQFSGIALIVSVAGSALLLTISNLLRREMSR